MKLLTELDSLDNVKDGETRKLVTKATSSGSGNVVSSVSVSGDTVTYTKGVTALTAHQNAFSNVKVGSTTVAADSAGDTLELVAGSNVTLTPDATNDKVTIAATDTTYESKAAASGGTAVSLVTTGEKYTWNNKQNALSTQTAYSAKGTATKVPQITTNTLGQVTKIEEVTITQPTVNNGTLTIQKNGTNVQTFSANQSGNATANITVPTKTSDLTNDSNYITNTGSTSGNAGTATKLQTARTIAIGTGATGTATSFDGSSNITIPITDVKESYVTWGGRALTDVTPDDAGCIDEFGHNKLAFLPASCITVEYTTDGGTTWLDYGLTDAQKIALTTTTGIACKIGKGTATASGGTLTNENCGNYKVRVKISTRDSSGSGRLYTSGRKWLINFSSSGAGGCKVKIEQRTVGNYNTGTDTWSTVGTYDIAGWSGWNSYPHNVTFGGGTNQTSNIADVRFTLSISSVNTTYDSLAQFLDFRLIGMTNWAYPSELARAGHIYTFDTSQNVTFPANVQLNSGSILLNKNATTGGQEVKWSTGGNDYARVYGAATASNAGYLELATADDANEPIYARQYTGQFGTLTRTATLLDASGNTSFPGTVTATNFTGLASKATGDKNGDDITTTYYKASNPNGYTSNTGTITGITMNGASKGTSGVVDLGTVITSHQSIKTINNNTITGTGNVSVGTITGVSVNGTSVATSGTANITSMPASILSGAIPSAVTATTQSVGDNSTKIATTAFVKTAIDNLPDPMVFKGSLGTGGTITALPVDGSASIGDTYKVITAGTYASKAAKVGDTFICLTKTSSANTWELIPSGDEPSGTVTSITIKGSSPITVDSESAITTSGTRTISHANSGVTAGTYRSVTVNATGHVTAGTNPTTLSGYGITDAKIASGVITLGSNTITPLTASSTLDATKISGTLPTSTYTDTKNTAGSTDSSSKLFLIGATSQAANPQTYSQDTAYVDTNGHLYSNSKQVVNLSDSQALTNKTYNGYTLAAACAKAVVTSIDTSASLPTSNAVKTFVEGKGYVTTDTKNTAGSTDTSSKIFLIGATSQAANPQTYSDNEVYATSGVLTTKSVQVGGTAATMQYNSTDKCIEFVFA